VISVRYFTLLQSGRHAAVTIVVYPGFMEITWRPPHASSPRASLPRSAFAFPQERKEPLTDAGHVRGAIARFSQVRGVTDRERALAFENIRAAAEHYGVALHAGSWHDLVG
jgi:hypothetical protein